MSEPLLTPGPAPERSFAKSLMAVLKGLLALVLVAAVSGGAAWGVFSYRIQKEQADTAAQVTALREDLRQQRDEVRQQQEQLAAKVSQVEKAAADAKLLLDQSGQATTLEARLKEIDTLKLDLKKTQDEMDAKLKSMEQSITDQVAAQSKETAQALALELRWKTLLVKAQGEVLLAQVHWAEGNRGLAKDELNLAAKTLQQAQAEAPDTVKTQIKPLVDLAEQAKSALIMEQSGARDSLNLLWHHVSDLLAMAKQ